MKKKKEDVKEIIRGIKRYGWGNMARYMELSEDFIGKNGEILNWELISKYQVLSEKFIEKYADKVNWDLITIYQTLSEGFIEKFKDKINWELVSQYQPLSEGFMEKYKDKVRWLVISTVQSLTEDFMERNKDRIYWMAISMHQELSEGFIEKYADKVDWSMISIYQRLSEGFIEKHKDKLDWAKIKMYQKLSEGFRKKYGIRKTKNNWIYASEEEKEKYIREKTPYEIKKDRVGKYIEAYKLVRRDGYSFMTFRYKYEVGNECESNCDCDMKDRFGFGITAGIKGDVMRYRSGGKIIKVKIYIRDIGAIVKGKIRCFKLKVIKEVGEKRMSEKE